MVVYIPAPEKKKQQDNCEFKASQFKASSVSNGKEKDPVITNQMIEMGTPEFWGVFTL